MPGHGARFWADRTTAGRRRSFPTLTGDHRADVVVIGGGLTGCATAAALAAGGVDVMLVEAERLAGGATAGALGVIVPVPGHSYRAIEQGLGRRSARTAWKETRRSAKELATALRKLPVKSDLDPVPLLINARSSEQAAELRREQRARKGVGLDAPWLTPQATRVELGTDTTGAIRLQDAGYYDPVRATMGFAKAAEVRGARIFERSPVKRTKYDRTEAQVVLAKATIRTRGIVVATGEPGSLAPQLRRHVKKQTGYVVVTEPLTAAMRREAGRRHSVMTEVADAPSYVRWTSDGRAMFSGGLSRPVGPRARDKAIVQRTAQLMYEFSIRYPAISGLPAAWGWDVPVLSTIDNLPCIGPHRNYPFHFFALGFGWHGDAWSWLAARAALRYFRDDVRPEDEVFGFGRLN